MPGISAQKTSCIPYLSGRETDLILLDPGGDPRQAIRGPRIRPATKPIPSVAGQPLIPAIIGIRVIHHRPIHPLIQILEEILVHLY